MVRKLLFILMLALLVIPFASQAQDEPVTLTFQHFFTDPEIGAGLAVQTQLDAWLAEHPNVTVEMETVSHDEYYTKFRVLAASNELPDMFIMNADMTTPLAAGGLLMDITDDLNADPEWRDLQNPGGMWEWTRNDRVYGLPAQMIITHVIYYNRAILEEVGVTEFPDTWEGFTDAIVQLREAGYTPIALGAKAGWPLFDCLFGTLSFRVTGLDWYNRLLAHEAAFTDSEFVRVLEVFQNLVEMGAFNEDANSIDNAQARTLYYNGEAAMFMEGNWAIGAGGISTDAPEEIRDNTGMALYPAIPDGLGADNQVTWAAGWGWSLNANLTPAEREAAISLLKAISNEDYGRIRIEEGDLSAQTVTDYNTENLYPLFVELNQMSTEWEAVPILTLGFPASVTDVLWTGLAEIISGQSTPEEVAAETQAEYEKYVE